MRLQLLKGKVCCRYQAVILVISLTIFILHRRYRTLDPSDKSSKSHLRANPEAHVNISFFSADRVRNLLLDFERLSLTDTGHSYRYVPNLVAPPSVQEPENSTIVTVCTQTSDNHLHYVEDIVDFWKGPVSITVFTTQKRLASVVLEILRLHNCNDLVRRYARFHVCLAVTHSAIPYQDIDGLEFDCSQQTVSFKDDQTLNYNHQYIYPSNLFRTISLKYAETSYVTILDIDLVPSRNLHTMLQSFLMEYDQVLPPNQNKVAYVLPLLEYKLLQFTPLTKDQVIQMWPHDIRAFHVEFCKECQSKTDYNRWLGLKQTQKMEVGYDVRWEMIWEPIYVARKRGLPLFDPSFKNYGFNRLSQLCEMHVAGYDFKVLNNGFVVHRGIKSDSHKLRPANIPENQRNRDIFNHVFSMELRARYPYSDRKCWK